ncbi:ABC transporter permease [Crateriforma conspicua]|uniref:Outer membrane-specific lipoprotein transporter subunit LolC n=1 Tax=Crateriforma conspicua TaxID=2527996 RepID=A0A5C6FXK1_9PLAN|nr:ABC transporter permease [Crateriforma conspicua]TWU65773.1 outer membrane-specific lipoprotein transporter subunit LolC [Crateriforma conspicua]
MRSLHRKMFRELWQSRGQSLAIAAVIASGVAVFVMSLGTLRFLLDTRDAYYDRYRFADLFVTVNRAPVHLADTVALFPGVARVQSRIVSDVTLDVPGLAEPAVGRIISLPDRRPLPLNNLHLKDGRFPDPQRPDEVLVSAAFVDANNLGIGDRISAIINERLQELVVVGVALSPEYVFEIRGGDLLPDNRRFGVFWQPERHVEAAFDMDGAFNSLAIQVQRGGNIEDIKARLDRLLEPYGSVGAIDRTQQLSARFLDDEIRSLRSTGLISPIIFLSVAAFLLNLVASRRVATQRGIIASLKAFGYTNREIGWHYLQPALMVSTMAAVTGSFLGYWMGGGLAKLYMEFYRFPTFVYQPDYRVIALAIVIALVAAVIGSLRSVYRAIDFQPAEAMRPEAPKVYRRSWLERLGLSHWFPVVVRMIVRTIERKSVSAAMSSLGIAAAVSVVVMSGFFQDALDELIRFQFWQSQRHDIQLVFTQTTSPDVLDDLRHMRGVQHVEPMRAVAVRLRHQHHDYRTSILGLDPDGSLYRLLRPDGRQVIIPNHGIVVSDALAERLDVRAGDLIHVQVLEGQRPSRDLVVSMVTKEYAGMNAYMDRQTLNRLMSETDAVSAAFLTVDSRHQATLYQDFKQTPRVAAVSVKRATVEQFDETIAKNQNTMLSFTLLFAGIIAVGVVYNTARIAVDERARELATLRVIGFTRGEVSTILLGELALITLAAIPLGWAIGYGFCYAMVKGFESESFRIPLTITAASYARSALLVTLASAISGLIVRRRLDHLDLVDVLKSRE